ncbi:hypothetical protein HTZ84_08395 [Haloterrigena sp. SYSU A558-1]|uniref:Uncharacterized protein n=1 Tax=Haloterrigena gelatinilytica TaxID=2741724 RepID=A0ABX2LAC3_9EURY|nr:hypothetical protein [Haloterrigena gelatinilytica]NUC72328.1 hypothetical protein [Haloterrigena gelatinilytica]
MTTDDDPDSSDGTDGNADSADGTDADAPEFEPDPERVAALRDVADDVRGETSESKQLANVLYRTSDLYDPDEETTPEEIVRNVKFILEVTERGGLDR